MTKNFRWWFMMATSAFWFVLWAFTKEPVWLALSNMWNMGALMLND